MWGELDENEDWIYIRGEGWLSCDIDGEHIWIYDESKWYPIEKNDKEVYIYNR
jgi:hypothetical protein